MSWYAQSSGNSKAALEGLKSTLQSQRVYLGEKGEKVLDECITVLENGTKEAPGSVSLITNGHINPDGSGTFGISASMASSAIPQSER